MAKSDEKSLPDQAIEALVYAPIGIAFEVLDRLPGWVARGKSQATITRLLGKMAVQKGQNEFEGVVSDIFGVKLGEDAPGAQDGSESSNSSASAPTKGTKAAAKASGPKTATVKASTAKGGKPQQVDDAEAAKPKATKSKATKSKAAKSKATKSKAAKPKATKSKAAKPKATKTSSPVAEADLALASYGSMPASQIVKRLDSLSADQLADVRSFEEDNRHRVTILNRIRQIQRNP